MIETRLMTVEATEEWLLELDVENYLVCPVKNDCGDLSFELRNHSWRPDVFVDMFYDGGAFVELLKGERRAVGMIEKS